MGLTDQQHYEPLTEIVIPSNLRAARKPEQLIVAQAERCGYSQDATFAIKLALVDAITNAFKHANRHDSGKCITIRFAIGPDRTIIKVRDEGQGFRLTDVPDPTTDENLECPTGRGIVLMQAYMNHVGYNEQGNEVTMIKVSD